MMDMSINSKEIEQQPDSLIERLSTPLQPWTLESSKDALVELVNELDAVDVNSPLANLNATTISDNNGGRIELSEDPDDPENLKKQGLEPNDKSKRKEAK
jgi:hypothetical protein